MKGTALATLLLIVATVTAAGCRAAPGPRDVQSLSGAELYARLCASCHGVSARGDGALAPLMSTGMPDLTLLARRDGGEFPAEDVRRAIDGRWDRRAHGERDMPVWGWRLYDMSTSETQQERARVDSMIDRLVNHLQSVQRP